MRYTIPIDENILTFDQAHAEVMANRIPANYLTNKTAMAQLQKDFYDTAAHAYQHMDDVDQEGNGFWFRKMLRIAHYDHAHFNADGKRMLYVGAGNCRLARIFVKMGYDVTATDISVNLLEIGKSLNDAHGIPMRYVVQNAEVEFPFESEQFDIVYSQCVINHIVDWHTYLREKMRCLKKGGILYERLPNIFLWNFWKHQDSLYDGVEAKALLSHKGYILSVLKQLGLKAEIWTHDRQTRLVYKLPLPTRKLRRRMNQFLYRIRTSLEDRKIDYEDLRGVYTVFRIKKT